MITHDVATITHLQMAYNQGIGQIQEDKIELIGASRALQVDWKPADITEGFLEVLGLGLHLLTGC